jgi:hypothetical protein
MVYTVCFLRMFQFQPFDMFYLHLLLTILFTHVVNGRNRHVDRQAAE